MKKNKRKPLEHRLPRTALNVVRETAGGSFQVYQIYAGMSIPLLGKRIRGVFTEIPADTRDEAFDRLYKEYYEG